MSTFVNNDVNSGDVIEAADHNTQGALIAAVLNGGIDNDNISASAGIAGTKLADSAVTTAKIADANVTSEKLASTIAFKAWGNVTTTLTDNSPVQITFGTEVYDLGNNFASNAFTAPVSGVYHFSMGFSMGTTASGARAFCLIYVDGVENTRGGGHNASSSTPNSMSTDIRLTAGQVVTFWGFQDSAGNEDTSTSAAQTWCCGHLIGAA